MTKKRWKGPPPLGGAPEGGGQEGLANPDFALRLAAITTGFEHLQKHLVKILMPLLGTTDMATASVVLHGIRGARTRREFIRYLLRRSPRNAHFGDEFDDVLDELTEVTDLRNRYVHGLWCTHENGTVSLAPSDEYGFALYTYRPVELAELDDAASRILGLTLRLALFNPDSTDGTP